MEDRVGRFLFLIEFKDFFIISKNGLDPELGKFVAGSGSGINPSVSAKLVITKHISATAATLL